MPSGSIDCAEPSATRKLRNAATRETAGKPCAGNPHARFERGSCRNPASCWRQVGSTNATNSRITGSSSGATIRAMFACARWYRSLTRAFLRPPNGPALSCRPPVSVPRLDRRPPGASTSDRAAGGWRAWHTPEWRPVSSNAVLDGASRWARGDHSPVGSGTSPSRMEDQYPSHCARISSSVPPESYAGETRSTARSTRMSTTWRIGLRTPRFR